MLRKVDPALAHRIFYPSVAAVLTAKSGKTVAAMPVISYSALSQRPPLFGVSCAKDSFTLRVARAAGAFGVCVLGSEEVSALSELAKKKGSFGEDKLETAGLKHREGTKLGVPIILGSAAVLECSLLRGLKTGDHFLLLGKIESAKVSGDFRNYWRFKSYSPMLYARWDRRMTLYRP